MGIFKKKPKLDPVNTSLKRYFERIDNIMYAKGIADMDAFTRNPEYVPIILQKRILDSQTPKWVNILMLILVALTLLISTWACFILMDCFDFTQPIHHQNI